MRLCNQGAEVLLGILFGTRSHKDLKDAFDWEDTVEGHRYWSQVRQADTLSDIARVKLERGLKEFGITV